MAEDHILMLVQDLLAGRRLSEQASQQFFDAVVKGQVDDVLLTAAITAIKVRKQTPDELAGAALALLDSATPFPRPDYAFADVVGTGGDGQNTINISTITAITAACCGVKIIKHGNRSISSVSGSFDLLERLGVDLTATPEQLRQQVDDCGISFLFAPQFHSGMRHAGQVRKTLRTRTMFNLLGPLVNPARPPLMLLGVADPTLLQPIAKVLGRLGCEAAYVVHGSGVDEVAVHDKTTVVELRQGQLKEFEVCPTDFGCDVWPLNDLVCHEAGQSHQRSVAVMEGRGTAAENAAVSVNVAMVLQLFGEDDLKKNFATAQEALETGKPKDLIDKLVKGNE
ncbi:MAG: anthranilate phosphoribosyltransferase [Pirellulaceae bacterium]|nr:anthranilate phosphoribosyltransferase [Pirellulaceae bacterium]